MKASRKAGAKRSKEAVNGAQGSEAIDGSASSVPVTLPSRVPAPPPDPFWTVGLSAAQRAKLLRPRIAIEKVTLFQYLISQSRTEDKFSLENLFEITFGDRTGSSFWRIRLGEMINANQLVALLTTFLLIEGGSKSTHELALRSVLSGDLTDADVVPPLREVVHAPIMTEMDPLSVCPIRGRGVEWPGLR